MALKEFGPYKAAGPDELFPIMLQALPDNALKKLISLYKASLALEYVPELWRNSKVIFIPKNKPAIKGPRDVRPISLATYMLKALERVVLWCMEETVLKKTPP